MTETENKEAKQGVFFESLRRTAKQVKEDRALAITEDAQLQYRRTVEDLEVELKKFKRDLENMLDMSPDNIQSLKVATDFNAKEFTDKRVELGLKIRNAEIKLEIATKDYNSLFGGR